MKTRLIVLSVILLCGCATQYKYKNYPQLYSPVTTEQALKLSQEFKLDHTTKIIMDNPNDFNPWLFDGCSGLIDHTLGTTGVNWSDITYKACLPHDIEYAYGIIGDEPSRLAADMRFCVNLIDLGVDPEIVKLFYTGVRYGGAEYGLSFSWGFARK